MILVRPAAMPIALSQDPLRPFLTQCRGEINPFFNLLADCGVACCCVICERTLLDLL